jgi:hypothetical protein
MELTALSANACGTALYREEEEFNVLMKLRRALLGTEGFAKGWPEGPESARHLLWQQHTWQIRTIAPPGQEGWREAPGWWFKRWALVQCAGICAKFYSGKRKSVLMEKLFLRCDVAFDRSFYSLKLWIF